MQASVEFSTFAQFEPDWMEPRGEVNEEARHLAAAGAWGLFPETDAVYINYAGPPDPWACYTATYDTPETDAFWSITVYGSDGFMKSDANVINDRNVTPNGDGTFTAFFGSEAACGSKPNRVDISEGWNFLMRIYRPDPEVLSREYTLPEVSVFQLRRSGRSQGRPCSERYFLGGHSNFSDFLKVRTFDRIQALARPVRAIGWHRWPAWCRAGWQQISACEIVAWWRCAFGPTRNLSRRSFAEVL